MQEGSQQPPLSPDAAEQLFLRTADGVIITSADGVIAQVNPAATAILGLKLDDLMGRSPSICFTNNLALLNLFTRSGDQVLDVRLARRRLAVGTSTPLVGGGKLVILRDVTEQRELDSRRVSLAQTIAHDLRNPINAIGGFAELVERSGDINEEQKHLLERIRHTTGKLREVIADLVSLAWLEAGMPMQHVPIQMETVILNAITGCSPQARDKTITIATSIQNPMPPVMGDPARLRDVLEVLLTNAITYSDAERLIVVHAWGDEREAYCSVADQGFGISDDEIHQVFDRMYRSKDERVRAIPGGGLGLTLARRIITRMGGDIWVSSNLGKGSTFTFYLPAAQS